MLLGEASFTDGFFDGMIINYVYKIIQWNTKRPPHLFTNVSVLS
jgi:hypothetical protein